MRRLVVAAALLGGAAGCGEKAVMPNRELTDEEKAKVKAEDQQIDNEESGGSYDKQFKKKGGKKP